MSSDPRSDFGPLQIDALARAITLSRDGMRAGAGGPFGAVVMRDDTVIGIGYNRVLRDNDPTAHAEVVAIRAACRTIGAFALNDCTLYASCRPCLMCMGAALWARIPLCWYANTTEDAQRIGFDDALFYMQIDPQQKTDFFQMKRTPDHALRESAFAVFEEFLATSHPQRY